MVFYFEVGAWTCENKSSAKISMCTVYNSSVACSYQPTLVRHAHIIMWELKSWRVQIQLTIFDNVKVQRDIEQKIIDNYTIHFPFPHKIIIAPHGDLILLLSPPSHSHAQL